jgi:AraC family transcriptional activator FtrA
MPDQTKPRQTQPHQITSRQSPLSVAVVAYDRLCTFEFGIAVELFGLPRPELAQWYDFSVCALETGPLAATGGLKMLPDQGLEGLKTADRIIVPGWRDLDETPPDALLETLRESHARGAELLSFCSGAFVLAATGLLDGRRATTHWRYGERFRARFPDITFVPDVLYVDEARLATAAGSASAIDLSLHVIRRDFGPGIANGVARRLVVPPHREGGQAQYIEQPLREETSRLSSVLDWARGRLQREIGIDDLAAQAAMSRRTFDRQFRRTTGVSPKQWLINERVALSRELLETTALSVEEVATRAGFGSAMTLRHHFRNQVGISPTRYRHRFAQTTGAEP